MSENLVDQDAVEGYYKKLKNNAKKAGYHLNADEEFTKELLESILINKDRYGYESCPCRLASGDIRED
ncbi:MAG: ferredoxin:glutaredoxin reductase, partial [Euryarchaeota archaeon]|nr:ferredoxin:glutaredoxin reductase [Euryarchaeota archaeon]